MKKMVIAMFIVSALISTSVPGFADEGASATGMVMDVFIARPGGMVATVLGSAVFIVALPFAAISGSVDPVVQKLVVAPFKFTFTRPVGDFSCWE